MSESTYRDLLSRLHPMHLAFGEDATLHFCSEAVEAAFPGAKTLFDLFAPNSAQELLALAQELQRNALNRGEIDVFSIQRYTTWHCLITRLNNDGSWLLCMESSDKQTQPKIVDGNLSHEETLNLQRQNLFYEGLLHQLPAEVAVFDGDFKFLFVNQHAIKNAELRKWLIGRSEIEYWKSKSLPLDKALQRIEGFKKAVAERKSTAVEEIFHPGTEQEKQYIRVTHPYFKDDELQFLLTYGIDITSLKHTESKLLQQNSELEKVNAELDQFVYSASHNLRAPLLSMKGLLSLISLEDTRLEDRNRFMLEVYKSIERLDATIHDIIEYSKNARLELNPLEIDLSELLETTADDLRFYEQTPVEITKKLKIESPFYSDPKRVKSVIHNLLSNCVKYADTSKTSCWVRIDVYIDDQYCNIRIEDNGIGIRTEDCTKVFDMFYRGTSKRMGSGLGLYIVKEMIHKMGGTIELRSELGVGTSIQITLPNMDNMEKTSS